MADKKSIKEWEPEYATILVKMDGLKLDSKVTREEFEAMLHPESSVVSMGVNHEDRIKFLEENGYEVTRENMINRELSSNG